MSGVEHLGGDRYRVRVYAGRDIMGRPRQVSRTFRASGQRDAKRKAVTLRADLAERVRTDSDRRATVAGLVDIWQKHRDAVDSPSTVRGRKSYVARIRADIGHLRSDQLTARHLDTWYAALRDKGRSPTTIHNHHVLVRAIIRQGWKWGECPMSTVEAVERASPPRGRARRPQPPTTDALAVLLADATPDLRVAAHLAAATGMRRGEILGLRWADITGPVITVARSMVEHGNKVQTAKLPKTGEPRIVAVGPSTLAVLAEHRASLERSARALGVELADDAAVIPDLRRDQSGRTPRRVGWLTLAWRRHAARHGARVRFHDLRHWHATQLLDQGVPVATVQHRLGHAKPTTTLAVYTHAVAASDERAVAVVEDQLNTKEAR